LLRSEAGTPGRIRVWVMNKNGHGVENIRVALQTANQHFDAATTSDGAARVYAIETGPFKINPSHKDFYFEINGDAITQVLFKDERLAIDGRDLVMKYWNKQSPIRYEI